MITITFDVETTGLPSWPNKTRQYYPPELLEMYDSSRVVSIAWIIQDLENKNTIQSRYFIIKPDGFTIPQASINIHNITNEEANANGLPISRVLNTFYADILMYKPTCIVAHNLSFDYHVIKSELHRANRKDIIAKLTSLHPICTMRRSKTLMDIPKFPKLAELYKFCFPEKELQNAHNALYDTKQTVECLQYLYDTYKTDFIL